MANKETMYIGLAAVQVGHEVKSAIDSAADEAMEGEYMAPCNFEEAVQMYRHQFADALEKAAKKLRGV